MNLRSLRPTLVGLMCALALGCGPADAVDAGVVDAGVVDAGVVDAGVVDAGVVDAGLVDAGVVDAGVVDAGVVDAGVVDAGVVDAGVLDAGVLDAGVLDAGVTLCALPVHTAPTLTSWLAPPINPLDPQAFNLTVDALWSSPAAVLALPDVGGAWLTESNPQSLTVGPKMTFFGLGAGCPQGATSPAVAPSSTTFAAALAATGVNGATVPTSLRWTPSSTNAVPSCATSGLSGESTGFIEAASGGGFWVRTVSAPQAWFGPFDAQGQSGSGANTFIQGSFASFRQPHWLSTTPRPFGTVNRMRLRTTQSVSALTVGPSTGAVTQAKQQLTLTLLNVACLNQVPVPGPCQVQYLFTTAIKRSDVTDWSTVSWFQDSSLMFDPAQGSLPVFDVPLQGLNVVGVEGTSRLPLYRSQGEGMQFAPFSKKTFDVAIEWSEFVNALKVVVGRKNATAPSAVNASELAAFWGASWADPSQWVLLQVEFGQETYNPRVATTAVEVTGAWHDLFIGPQPTALQSVPLTQGFFCSGTTDVLYACGVEHAAKAALEAAGWVDVGGSCFHHVGNGACIQAPTCASRGVFCRQNHSIEFLCDCPTPPVGFVPTSSGFFEHDTGVGCL